MNNNKRLPETCELMGHKIKLANIINPHIHKAIRTRSNFLFNHSDCYSDGWHETCPHHDHNQWGPNRNQHLDHAEYNEHSDASDYG